MAVVMIGARGQAEHDTLARLVNRELLNPLRILDIPPDEAPANEIVAATDWATMQERIYGTAVTGVKFSRTITIGQTNDARAVMDELARLKAGYPAIEGMWIQRLSDPAEIPETCPECGRAYGKG